MLRAAVIGLGWWGRQIVTSLVGSDRIRIAHAVEVDVEAARGFAKQHGLKLGADYEAVLADPKIDAVILVTPHALHEPQVLAAARAGKQVFCEKPLALSAAGAERMHRACDKAGVTLGIGHERRFEPALEALKRHLDGGDLGTLVHLECNWSHNNFTKAKASGWRKDPRQAPLGTLTALGVHITDYFQSLAGRVATVGVQTADRSPLFPGNDVVSVRFRFESGATAVMTNIATTPFYSRITVLGDKGWAEARESSNVDVPEPATLTTRWLDEELTVQTFRPINTVRANLEQWADAIEGKGTYRFTRDQKVHNVAILEAIVKAAATGLEEAVG